MLVAQVFARAQGRASRRIAAVLCFATLMICSAAAAQDDLKRSCLEAHSEGQDEIEQGHVALARGHFSACAQPTCPDLVKDDCARLLADAERALPSLSFSARDTRGVDLADTRVFVDGMLVIARLDGIWHDVDPGMHVVRFEHGGRSQQQEIIVAAGEKGRLIVEVFAAAQSPSPLKVRAQPTRRVGPGLAIGTSVALVGVGGALLGVGLARVPDMCSVAKHQCAAPPGDHAFREASRAVRLSNVGWAVGGVGLAALTASLIWYFKTAGGSERARRSHAVSPFASTHEAGIAVSGSL